MVSTAKTRIKSGLPVRWLLDVMAVSAPILFLIVMLFS